MFTRSGSVIVRARTWAWLISLCVIACVSAVTAAPALAAPPETPETLVPEAGVGASTVLRGVIDPKALIFPVAPGTYQFLYKVGAECEGGSEVPVPPGKYSGLEAEPVSQPVTGLESGVEYSVCLQARNTAQETSVGPAVHFRTPEGPETKPASEVTETTARLNGVLNPNGKGEAGSYEFLYRASSKECQGGSATGATSTGGAKEAVPPAEVSGLLPGSVYTFCLLVRSETGGAALGSPQTFRTPATAPAVAEPFVTEVASTSVTLHATVTPDAADARYRFLYAPSGESLASGHVQSAPAGGGDAGEGGAPMPVSAYVTGLSPATAYHFRVIAENEVTNKVGKPSEGEEATFTTQTTGAFALPEGRAWELVSPPNKHGSPLEPITEEGGIIQAAAGGGGLAFVALGPVGSEPSGVQSPWDTQLLARRGSGGWTTEDITTPHESIAIAIGGFPSEYKQFSVDLASAVVEPKGATPLSPQTTERTPYRREAGGEYVPLVTSALVLPGVKFGGVESEVNQGSFNGGLEFLAGSPDLSHVVLSSPQVLTPGFAPGFVSSEHERPNLYELSGGTLRLISILPPNVKGEEKPAAEAELAAGVGDNSRSMRGAVSADGNRVVFETTGGGKLNLYVRDVGLGSTVQIDVPQKGAPGGGEQAHFQGASSDGSKVFFTDESQLTTDPPAQTEGRDLYMCEVAVIAGHLSCALSDLTVDLNPGEQAGVAPPVGEVSAIDPAGRYVYFVANGVLTKTPNAHGESALPGNCQGEETCNMYVYDTVTKHVQLVAVLSSSDSPDWAGEGDTRRLGNLTTRVSPSGRYLAFMSQRSLTGYDNRDAVSGQPDEEVFLFDVSTGRVRCVSCSPSGARPHGVFGKDEFPGLLVDHPRSWRARWLAGSIPGWTLGPEQEVALYQSRYLSDSGRMFFNSADPLVPKDTNGVEDVYQYEPPGVGSCTESSATFSRASSGCVDLISSGTATEESAFLDASESGNDVFFLTAARLTSTDVDSAFDVYDAHVCSSESPCPPPPPPPPPACQGDACQSPAAAPSDPTPGSLTFSGPGNLVPSAPVAKPLTPAQIRAQKLAKALKACRTKHNKGKRKACEAQARKRYGPTKAKKASHKRRARP